METSFLAIRIKDNVFLPASSILSLGPNPKYCDREIRGLFQNWHKALVGRQTADLGATGHLSFALQILYMLKPLRRVCIWV
jgi:hypothetical protein